MQNVFRAGAEDMQSVYRGCADCVQFCRSFNYNCVILLIETKKLKDSRKMPILRFPLKKKQIDTLVGPNETEKIDTAVLSAIILSFYITQRGGLTDKAVVCDAGGPWFKSS